MLNSFAVLSPPTVAEATRELARLGERARVYAGGSELLLLLRHRLVEADYLINVKGIAALGGIAWDNGSLRIGATVTHRRLESDPLVQTHLPMFSHAESQVANVRVRNQGTLGGNLCFNDPHSDSGTALLAYEARVKVTGKDGERRMALNEFFVDVYATKLQAGEILTEIEVPPLPPGFGTAYLRVHRFQRPTLGVAAAVRTRDGLLGDLRLAIGCVGPRPERLGELERSLSGLKLADARRVIDDHGAYLSEILKPVDDLLGSAEYKLYLARVLLGRALSDAARNGIVAGNA